MKPTAMRQIKNPVYPTRREFLAGAAAFVAGGFAGAWRLFAAEEAGGLVVAPIFEHGKGVASPGNWTRPPIYVSEDEAKTIIRNELSNSGVDIRDKAMLQDVLLPIRTQVYEDSIWKIVEKAKISLPITGMDPTGKIAVLYISDYNFQQLGVMNFSLSLAASLDYKEFARGLKKDLDKQGKARHYLGILYDPIVYVDELAAIIEASKVIEATTASGKSADKQEDYSIQLKMFLEDKKTNEKNASKNLLRLQVQDFAGWLKEQKVI
jgi:hypothetical protein